MLKHMVTAAVAATTLMSADMAFAQTTPAPTPAPQGITGVPKYPAPVVRPGIDRFETQLDTEARHRAPQLPTDKYRLSLIEAECAVRLDPARAAAMIGGEGTKDPFYSDVSRVASWHFRPCMRGPRSQIVPMMLSAAIAEQLVLANAGAGFDDRARTVNIDEAARFHGDLDGRVSVERIGRCLAVYSPGLAYKVLQTKVASTEETAALDALYARTAECNVHKRPTNISAAFQRSAIAEGLYFWTHKSS